LSGNGQNIAGYRTNGETVSHLASFGGTLGGAVVEPDAGTSAVVMLDPAGDEVWRTGLRAGLVVDRLEMNAALAVDVYAEDGATRRGVVLPLNAAGAMSWRVEREGATVSNLVSSAGALYVILSDEDGVDLARIPRE
jgi:hypothetical protein